MLTTLIQVAGGFVTGLAVAIVGFRYARKLEGDRRVHEAAIRSNELERQRSERWLRDVREVAARVISQAERVTVTLAQKKTAEYLETQMAFNQAAAEIRLLSAKLVAPTEALVNALADYGNHLSQPGPAGDPLAKGDQRDAYLAAVNAFEQATAAALRS